MPGVFFQTFSLAPSCSAHRTGQRFACQLHGFSERGQKTCVGHTATSGMLSTDIDVRALPQVTLQNCSIYATFQPPLGFDLGVGGDGFGKEKKKQECDKREKGKPEAGPRGRNKEIGFHGAGGPAGWPLRGPGRDLSPQGGPPRSFRPAPLDQGRVLKELQASVLSVRWGQAGETASTWTAIL